jgi:aldose 1-epimerase
MIGRLCLLLISFLPVILKMLTKINPEAFNKTLNGEKVSLHFLKNQNNIEIAITNYGARIVALIIPDKDERPTDIVAGFDSLDGYLNSTETYHGAIVGRYANRIARGKFSLNGKSYQLSINNPPNHLHGGPKGFNNQVWKVEETKNHSIKLSYFSKDGEENYPGNLNVSVTYTLNDQNVLIINYEATTDQTTVFNITSHPFFNLNGQGSGSIENHLLQINASNYTPVDDALIPTGIFTVAHTPFDFRSFKKIGENINDENEQLKFGAGYDHNFVLDGEGMRTAGIGIGDKTGIQMEVITDQPGMQLYTGNYMKGENTIKYGLKDNHREAFCLETQHFPDSPNHPEFPTTVLNPGDVFYSATIYKFSVKA